MIKDKRMKLVKSENGINYYLFTPSLFSLYYNENNQNYKDEPPHRYSFTHRLHMMWYVIFAGGYKILYLERNAEILSYIIFIKANSKIISNSQNNDYYTIYLWTYPEYRGKGLATLMSKMMLNDLNIDYNNFYKTINKDNISSIRVAEKCGFCVKCDSVKSRWLHTIKPVDNGEQYLYFIENTK